MAWTGFTDDQLKALKRQGSEEDEKPARGSQQGQHSRRGRGRSGPNRGRGRTPASQAGRPEHVTQDQMLSRPKPSGPKGKVTSPEEYSVWSELKEPTQRRPPPARRKPPPAPEGDKGTASDMTIAEEGQEKKEQQGISEEERGKENEEVKMIDEREGKVRELSKMEEFQEKQKQMEAENAKKKNLLSRAIADRKKKTQAETKRLAYIQKELAKIENLLTTDVSILRDRIETASRDFNDAQRRYQKAETEFVAAKISLHKMSEMKEALTEHLCTIIHENELRKAKKLEELVSKLDVDNLDDFEEIPGEVVKPTPPTSPVQSAPQTDLPSPPSENNVAVPEPSKVPEETVITNGDSTAVSGGLVSSNLEGQSQSANVKTSDESEGKGESQTECQVIPNEIQSPVDEGKCQKDDKIAATEINCTSSNDQPEAEQHVEVTLNQT